MADENRPSHFSVPEVRFTCLTGCEDNFGDFSGLVTKNTLRGSHFSVPASEVNLITDSSREKGTYSGHCPGCGELAVQSATSGVIHMLEGSGAQVSMVDGLVIDGGGDGAPLTESDIVNALIDLNTGNPLKELQG